MSQQPGKKRRYVPARGGARPAAVIAYGASIPRGPTYRGSRDLFASRTRGSELKYIDNQGTPSTMYNVGTTANAFQLINGVAQGLTETSRIGQRVRVKKITVVHSVIPGSTTTGSGALNFRLVYDRQTNGAAPAATDMFDVDVGTTLRNPDTRARFKVLMHEKGHVTAYTMDGEVFMFERTIKCNYDVFFNVGTGGTVASMTSGSIYAVTAQNGLATAGPSGQVYYRVWFEDA
jgi:hypothetical protein